MTRGRSWLVWALLSIVLTATLAAAQPPVPGTTTDSQTSGSGIASSREPPAPEPSVQLEQLRYALQRLPVAAGLAALLALRPRRRGTPPRQAQVVQTQIILAIVGAVVMLVVGTSLARAFGIVGAAGLVRYRAKIDDPKDAGVMLSTLAIGLGAGVGLWMLAAFSTVFVLIVLWMVESFEPKAHQLFTLHVKAKEAQALKPRLEALLARHRLQFDLRSSTPDEVTYEVRVPVDKHIDRLSNGILALERGGETAVEWEEKKEKK